MGNKNILYACLGIIAIALFIYIMGRRSIKKQAPKDVKLPADTQGVNVPKNWNPGPFTDALEQEIYGHGLRDAQPYNDVLALSNSQLAAIHNDWNKRYYTEDNETLRTAIEAEKTTWNYSWTTASGAVIERLKSLGL